MTEQQVPARDAWFTCLRTRAAKAGRRTYENGTPTSAAALTTLLVEMRECARGRPLTAADIQTIIKAFMEAAKIEEYEDAMGTVVYGAELRDKRYKDSTPLLNVGDSSFEDWFQQQPFATEPGVKQMCRDAYAAGMGDPLVTYAATAFVKEKT